MRKRECQRGEFPFYKKNSGLGTLVRWHLNTDLMEVKKVSMWLSRKRTLPEEEPARGKA